MITSVQLAGEFSVHDGYAGMSEYIAVGLSRLGVRVSLLPFKLEKDGLSAEMLGIVEESGPLAEGPLVFNSWVRPELERFAGHDHLIHTMWESSRLPDCWIAPLNRARALMVPTRFVADMFRSSGITVPIEVTPDGVDPEVYPRIERPEREGITTLVVGTVVPRKHVPQAIAAWRLAFADDPTARLVIKARFGDLGRGGLTARDERITIVDENEPTRGILHWYEQADVLLALGSEGFGLPLVEGMATGLPVIALSSEGQGDVCADAGELVLAVPPAVGKRSANRTWGAAGYAGCRTWRRWPGCCAGWRTIAPRPGSWGARPPTGRTRSATYGRSRRASSMYWSATGPGRPGLTEPAGAFRGPPRAPRRRPVLLGTPRRRCSRTRSRRFRTIPRFVRNRGPPGRSAPLGGARTIYDALSMLACSQSTQELQDVPPQRIGQ
ncbi:hypothetical protein ACZ90_10160 [Streptomyces albus subsp. albus]|nr:hypothetical protein ACZ90_10160 [Streptomyces albus subsp. albus]